MLNDKASMSLLWFAEIHKRTKYFCFFYFVFVINCVCFESVYSHVDKSVCKQVRWQRSTRPKTISAPNCKNWRRNTKQRWRLTLWRASSRATCSLPCQTALKSTFTAVWAKIVLSFPRAIWFSKKSDFFTSPITKFKCFHIYCYRSVEGFWLKDYAASKYSLGLLQWSMTGLWTE